MGKIAVFLPEQSYIQYNLVICKSYEEGAIIPISPIENLF